MKILSPEKVVYLVRHGEGADNTAPVFQSPDSPLTEKGIEQAKKIAQRSANLRFEALISSPFTRAKQTAEEIARTTGIHPEYSELFVERIKPSYVNGKPYTDEKANALWKQWEESLITPGLKVEDGEGFDDILDRAEKALSFLRERPETTLLVVTHGFFLRTMVARVRRAYR